MYFDRMSLLFVFALQPLTVFISHVSSILEMEAYYSFKYPLHFMLLLPFSNRFLSQLIAYSGTFDYIEKQPFLTSVGILFNRITRDGSYSDYRKSE